MSDQTTANRVRETAKLWLRRTLHRANIDIGRGPYAHRLIATLRAHSIDTILDIGANVGQYGALARSSGFDGRIVGCEPLTGAYDVLARRAEDDPHWEVLHTAVGAEEGAATINVAQNSFSSS